MEIAIAIVDAIALSVLFLWAVYLRKKEQELQSIRREAAAALDEGIRQLQSAKDAMGEARKVWCTYRFSESDFTKTQSKMIRDAKERVAGNIGRRIVKEVGLEEIVEDGVLVGYNIEVEIQRNTK